MQAIKIKILDNVSISKTLLREVAMKSKLLALVMTGLLVLGMLAGCGSTNKTFGESAEVLF